MPTPLILDITFLDTTDLDLDTNAFEQVAIIVNNKMIILM